MGLYSDGACRGHFFGTFGISVVGSLGAAGLHILSPLTTTLNYWKFEPDGSLDVRLEYDHRVLDGVPVARVLEELEDTLHGEIHKELLKNAGTVPAAAEGIRPESNTEKFRRFSQQTGPRAVAAASRPVEKGSDP